VIIKVQKRTDPYARIDNRVLNDKRLSYRARGILAYLLSKPNDWEVQADDIVRRGKEGRDAVRAAFRELRDCGYAQLITTQQGRRWIIYETPDQQFRIDGFSGDAHSLKKPTTGNRSLQRKEEKNTENKGLRKKSQKSRSLSLSDAMAYGKQLGIPQNEVEEFHDHFTANGWKVGLVPMKDARAALRNWHRRTARWAEERSKRKAERPSAFTPHYDDKFEKEFAAAQERLRLRKEKQQTKGTK
jgi:hypothetical protein